MNFSDKLSTYFLSYVINQRWQVHASTLESSIEYI